MASKNDPASKNQEYKLVVSRDFSAPRELVWKAWTQPEQMKAWLSLGKDMAIESIQADLRVGGRFRIQMKRAEDGEYFTAAGSYLEVKPPEKLVYTWDWEKDGAGAEFGELDGMETQVTLEFQASGKGTKLVLTHEKFVSKESRDRHEFGWGEWLGRMAKYIEEKKLS